MYTKEGIRYDGMKAITIVMDGTTQQYQLGYQDFFQNKIIVGVEIQNVTNITVDPNTGKAVQSVASSKTAALNLYNKQQIKYVDNIPFTDFIRNLNNGLVIPIPEESVDFATSYIQVRTNTANEVAFIQFYFQNVPGQGYPFPAGPIDPPR